MFLSGYTKRWAITVDATKVPSTQTAMPLYADLSLLPTSFWSTVSNGGGDIRVTKADGITELAREVVSCDTATDTGELHFLADSVDGITDTVFYIYANGVSADYVVTAPYGSQAVWTSYNIVWHMNELEQSDSAGNIPNRVIKNDFTDPKLDSNGNIVMDVNDELHEETGDTGSFSDWSVMIYYDEETPNTTFGKIIPSNGNHLTFRNGFIGADLSYTSGFIGATANGVLTSGEQMIHITYDSILNQMSVYRNGVLVATSAGGDPSANWIGFRVYRIVAIHYEARGSKQTQSAAWITTEYNNQSSPATFYTIGAMEEDGGVSVNNRGAILLQW